MAKVNKRMKPYCRKCHKLIKTDRQPYRGIGTPVYSREHGYIYESYEHEDCNYKGKKPKDMSGLCKQLNKAITPNIKEAIDEQKAPCKDDRPAQQEG